MWSSPQSLVVLLLLFNISSCNWSFGHRRVGNVRGTTTTTTTPAATGSSPTRGVIFTGVKQWVSGRPQQVCVDVYQLQSVDVTVKLQNISGNKVYDLVKFTVGNNNNNRQQNCHPLTLSGADGSINKVRLDITATNRRLRPPYSFHRDVVVDIRRPEMTSFVETDKAVYKPSDTVRLRMLTVRGPDAQVVTDPVELVHIEDPSRTRIAQWTNIPTENGLLQLEMILSEEPPLGQWTITTSVLNHEQKAHFTVEEYVLPKFEVYIVHPSRLYYRQPTISWKVCAKYTYGEPVNGEVKLTKLCSTWDDWGIATGAARWKCREMTKIPLYKGCADLKVTNTSQLLPFKPALVWSTKLRLSAQVKERGTGVTLNANNVKVDLVQEEYEVDIGTKYNRPYFKPTFDYIGSGFVSRADFSPAINQSVSLQVRAHGYRAPMIVWVGSVETGPSGYFRFTIPADILSMYKNGSLQLQASAGERGQFLTSLVLIPWYSPSGSYMQLETASTNSSQSPAIPVKCRSQLNVNLVYKTPFTGRNGNQRQHLPLKFTYLVVSRGNVVSNGVTQVPAQGGAGDMLTARLTIVLDVTAAMSGSFDVVAFHVRFDGETVAAMLHVEVEPCFEHQVSMSFAKERVQPGKMTSILIQADDQSLCAVGVVDKSVELMGKSTWLTADKVDSMKQSYQTTRSAQLRPSFACVPSITGHDDDNDDDNAYDDGRAISTLYRFRSRRYIFPAYHRYSSDVFDSSEAFEYAGVLTLTDLAINTRPCSERTSERSGLNTAFVRLSALAGSERSRSPPSSGWQFDTLSSQEKERSVTATLHRTYFPDTWLWTLQRVKAASNVGKTADVSVSVPHTITEWVGGGYCISSQSGLGVAKTFKMTAFQPFFVSFTLPYSLVRGESVAIPVTVFNYLANTCLTVTLMVEPSESFELLEEGKSSPRASLAQLTVCPQLSETHNFNIVALQIGFVNFTIKATSEPDQTDSQMSNSVLDVQQATASDTVTRQLLVVSEGKEEEYTRSAYVCADDKSPDVDWSLTVPNDVVADSIRMRINVIGDVMGSGVSSLDKLLKQPTGCGEQNMLNFAPNIYVLEYLTATSQLTPELSNRAIKFLLTGYQRELTYRHTDGSYSAFGKSDREGSIWLTAFVLRSFAKARPFIFIDARDLDVSANWLRNQQLENGCFRSVGLVIHKEMTGGLQRNDTLSALTAYIVLSLLETDISNTDMSIVKGFRCLEDHADVDDVYTLSLMLYAYTLYGRDVTGRQRVLDKLNAKAIDMGGMKHWQSHGGETMTSSIAADVELTSYVLLSLVHGSAAGGISSQIDSSYLSDCVKIVRWLTTQRNADGGFASTQDTVLALQALSLYATKTFRRSESYHLTVNVSGQGQSYKFDITSANRLLQQSASVARWQLPLTVRYEVNGSGCALTQVAVKYNRLSLVSFEQRQVFELNVTVKEAPNSCKSAVIRTCARYTGFDRRSNMVLVETRMVSGWIPDKQSVNTLKNVARLGVKRIEIDKNVVNLYFDQLDRVQLCWNFVVLREVLVKGTKPAIVHIYDYYTPGTSVFSNYSLSNTKCNNDIRGMDINGAVSGFDRRPNDVKQRQLSRKDIGHQQSARAGPKCPKCLTDTLLLRSLLCSSTYVYNVSVEQQSVMRLQQTLRQPVHSSAPTLTFIKYKVSSNCHCSSLKTGLQLLVLTPRPLTTRPRHLVLDLRSAVDVSLVKLLPVGTSSSVATSASSC